LGKAFPYLNLTLSSLIQIKRNRGVGHNIGFKHDLKVHAKNTKSGKLQEKVFLSCVALKKEGPKRRFS
jgi:hypothetical protein